MNVGGRERTQQRTTWVKVPIADCRGRSWREVRRSSAHAHVETVAQPPALPGGTS